MTKLHGCIPIVVTPFTQEGAIDEASLVAQVRYLIDRGVHGLATPGLAGEGYKLTDAERVRVVAAVIDAADGDVPVVASAEANGTDAAVLKAREMAKLGAAALMVLPPTLIKPDAANLQRYFTRIAAAVDIPIMVQDAPQLTGVTIPVSLLAQLVRECPNITSVKIEGTPAGPKTTDVLTVTAGRMAVFAGWGGLSFWEGLQRGAAGCMPAPNFGPALARVYELFHEGQHADAKRLFDALTPFVAWSMQSLDLSVWAAKEDLRRQGVLETARLREPATLPDDLMRRQFDAFFTETHPMKPFDLTTLGEIMLRLSVPTGERLELAAQFDAQPGGAEANVAALLARLGRATAWCGSLPTSALGRLVGNHLRMAGVATEGIVWSDNCRLGTYFVEFTAPPRSIQVIYDRADSCAARLTADEVKWDCLLATRLLHLTGITPALSLHCLAIVQEARTRAQAASIPVSFDVNYRAKLWSTDEAARVLLPLATGVDLLFCGHGDAQRLFGCRGAPDQVVAQLAEQTRARRVIVTFGDAGVVGWDGERLHDAPALPVQIVDRLGAGDALAAGVIHGWLAGDFALGLRYGVALAALALSQHGDMVVTTPEELAALVASVGGLIER